MLPLHSNNAPPRSGGWREMAIVTDSPPQSYKRILRIRPFRGVSRLTFVVGAGALFCLWIVLTQLHVPAFLRPYPPPIHVHPHYGYDSHPPVRPPKRPGHGAAAEAESAVDWTERAEDVKKMFVRAYHAYEQYASQKDELRPLTNGSIDK